jgi:hypothetical protein
MWSHIHSRRRTGSPSTARPQRRRCHLQGPRDQQHPFRRSDVQQERGARIRCELSCQRPPLESLTSSRICGATQPRRASPGDLPWRSSSPRGGHPCRQRMARRSRAARTLEVTARFVQFSASRCWLVERRFATSRLRPGSPCWKESRSEGPTRPRGLPYSVRLWLEPRRAGRRARVARPYQSSRSVSSAAVGRPDRERPWSAPERVNDRLDECALVEPMCVLVVRARVGAGEGRHRPCGRSMASQGR